MADEEHIAKRDGPYRTNKVTVDPGYFLAPGYTLKPFDETEIGATGHHKVLGVVPVDDESPAPRFLGRWDAGAFTLDFDLVDTKGRVLPERPAGHHPKDLGQRCFEVEIGIDANQIIFKGIVTVRLGFKMHLGEGLFRRGRG